MIWASFYWFKNGISYPIKLSNRARRERTYIFFEKTSLCPLFLRGKQILSKHQMMESVDTMSRTGCQGARLKFMEQRFQISTARNFGVSIFRQPTIHGNY
jgi:hypothetical protein